MLATGLVAPALAPERAEAERIGWEAGTSRAVVAGIAMPSEEVPGDRAVTTARARAPVAAAAPLAWDLEEAVLVVAVEGGVDRRP